MNSSPLFRFSFRRVIAALALIAAVLAAGLWAFKIFESSSERLITLHVRHRNAQGIPSEKNLKLPSKQIGLVIVDLWDTHPDPPTKATIDAILPRLNQTLEAARQLGITNFFTISDLPLFEIPRVTDHRDPVRTAFADTKIKFPAFPGNSFFWPKQEQLYVPFERATSQVPPSVLLPSTEIKSEGIHPGIVYRDKNLDLFIDSFNPGRAHYPPSHKLSGWNQMSTIELYKTAKARGITHLLFIGGGANQCIINKGFGAVNMKRLGFHVYLVRDLCFSGSSNGCIWETKDPAPSIYPDRTNQMVIAWFESYFDGTVPSSDILEASGRQEFRYTLAITREPGLLSYWRMNILKGGRMVHDMMNTQSAWMDENSGIQPEVPGITPDQDGGLKFNGTSALIVAPFFRADTPPGSPLENLSSGSFTVEAWVRPDGGLGKNQWILSHDGGTDDSSDFLFGLDQTNHFVFTTAGGKNTVKSQTAVTPRDIEAKKIWHIVGIQDSRQKQLVLYVNGEKFVSPLTTLSDKPLTHSSLQIGSRGLTNIDDGEKVEGKTGKILSSGYEFFDGLIDEVAIYGTAVPEASVLAHFHLIKKN